VGLRFCLWCDLMFSLLVVCVLFVLCVRCWVDRTWLWFLGWSIGSLAEVLTLLGSVYGGVGSFEFGVHLGCDGFVLLVCALPASLT